MLINSVIIILREALEAALTISVLLAISQTFNIPRQRLIPSILLGVSLASFYAVNLAVVSDLYDGTGQELLNTALYVLIFSFILALIITINYPAKGFLLLAMSGCMTTALIREGAEVIIYIKGFWQVTELLPTVINGSIIGTGIGFSIGVFFYYFIVTLSHNNGLRVALAMLILIASAMMSQAVQQLIQADLVFSQAPLWDSSTWISEQSVIGQLLYALIGYEATPTPIQVYVYLFSLTVTGIVSMITLKKYQQDIDS